ncbi:hypothetical protein EBF03_04820 [Arcanobacterium haemolyticum]|uniref:Uncharacterized protein n=1 Tax=Arcanobacterium haemolyticum (strain ATCC 9345 / DSM 20595 / CCM 5947 / CCUG 17215 / LMG 16163 / NBRC 15585 / NCTC 8452 / 11018) TaxID=644284 RepID=D7BP42_ARCHD|nr:hypothetical protein [Arcanobacterium haemolyticum]ADH92691.1 hypothetical protein Arch_0969 [Arcanobacterium haemolyticum DSM 20595]QCX46801.1 hypothetical protein EBF03_04820 [Arcanobacterium haemolyticum]SPT74796.1 Uncharacterised protein [Arcanobacterium haemolyticum]SQH28572.1 Uncharacterised protein [Arcanobacterium haemolyticum]
MNSARRYIILTTFEHPHIVAAVLSLRGITASVVPTEYGAVVVRDIPVKEFDDWDISELLGETSGNDDSIEPSDQPELVAALLSELSPYGVVLMVAELGDDVGAEAGTSGIVSGVRYMNGERGEEIPGGLLLNAVDPLVEYLILGEKKPADIEGSVEHLSHKEIAEILGAMNPAGDENDA